jgi:PAS domain S-box-containing protein
MSTALRAVDHEAPTIERSVSIAFFISLAALVTLAAFTLHAMVQGRETTRQVQQSYQVIDALHRCVAALESATASVREYIMTGEPKTLEQRDVQLSEVWSSIQDLRELTATSPQIKQQVESLENLLIERVQIIDERMIAGRSEGLEAERNLMRSEPAAKLIVATRTLLAEIESGEQRLLMERHTLDRKSQRRLVVAGALLLSAIVFTVLLGLAALRRELTKRRRLAEELERSRSFLETTFGHSPSMTYVRDARDLRLVAVNRALADFVGRQREELVGRLALDFVFPVQAEEMFAEDQRDVASAGPITTHDREVTLHDGRTRTIRMRKTVIRGNDGAPSFLLSSFDDVTEAAAAQREILRLNESLKLKNAVLEAVNKEIESFSYSVSHDLRAPLNVVNGFAAMLEEDCAAQLDATGRRYVGAIREAVRHMGRLIDDLLDLSRLSRQAVSRERIDARALAQRAAQEILTGHSGPPPALIVHEMPEGEGDPSLLHHVWSNLIGNAVKYSSKSSSPCVEIGGMTDGLEVRYFVRDNGVGFDMRHAHKLFNVFQRLHRSDQFPGTGVGLAIVHRIVTRHGGRVWAQSEPGHGATFYFTLPIEPGV